MLAGCRVWFLLLLHPGNNATRKQARALIQQRFKQQTANACCWLSGFCWSAVNFLNAKNEPGFFASGCAQRKGKGKK